MANLAINVTEFRNRLFEVYEEYPQEIKEALFSFDVAMMIREIALSHGLSEDQIPILAGEVGNVLVGATRPEEMPERLEILLGISPALAGNIFREINRKIFFPLREKIAQAFQIAQKVKLAETVSLESGKPASTQVLNLKESSRETPLKKEERIEERKSIPEFTKDKSKEFEVKEILPSSTGSRSTHVSEKDLDQKSSVVPKIISPPPPSPPDSSSVSSKKIIFKEENKPANLIKSKEEIKPLGNIEKTSVLDQTSLSEDKNKGDKALFSKVEFPGGKEEKNSQFSTSSLPKFREIEYKKPSSTPNSFPKIISLKKNDEGSQALSFEEEEEDKKKI